MHEENNRLLVNLEVRLRQLIFLCDSLKDENGRLKTDIITKEKHIDRLTEDLEQLKSKHDSLKIARTITAASVDVDTAKIKLSKLVREVDKCINLLK